MPGHVFAAKLEDGDLRDDRAIFDLTTGKMMYRVAANPKSGQYVVDAIDQYRFSREDAGHRILLDAPAVVAAKGGKTLSVKAGTP